MYSLYVISNKPHLFNGIVSSLSPLRVSYFDGRNYKSFSSLVNACVASAGTETVIIMSDKVLPTKEHVEKTVELLERGYAFVALYRFAFFGFKKELMRKIGMMDEGYTGGGYEDDDFYIRLIEANLAMWVTHDVPYLEGVSSWDPTAARQYHFTKWVHNQGENVVQRALLEPGSKYNLGPSTGTKFLSGREFSYAPLQQVSRYFYTTIKS